MGTSSSSSTAASATRDGRQPLDLRQHGNASGAVLSGVGFDATAVDPATLSLGDGAGADTPVATRPNGTYHVSAEDVNGDALPDLVARFRVDELVANGDVTAATTSLMAQGFLGNGCTNFLGEDAVRIVP